MADYGRPGVYISERLLPAPISATGTANAAGAVLGAFAQGPTNVTLVTSWYDFVKQFGGCKSGLPNQSLVESLRWAGLLKFDLPS
jgi:hypothetical protein